MVRPGKDITGAELEIMRCLWELRQGTIRDVVDRLYEAPSRSNYQTARKLFERLENKGYVVRKTNSTAHTYRPLVQQSELIERRLHDVAESLCEGSTLPLLTCLLQGRKVSAAERRRLHELFAELTDESSAKGKR